MLDALLKIDQDLFLFLNGIHNDFFDFIMFWLSNKFIWIPFYVFMIFLLYKHFKKNGLYMIITIVLLVGICDLISVYLFKNIFERLRPTHSPELEGIVHIVKGYVGGQYGFLSSHAANSFTIAVFLNCILKPIYKRPAWLLILWAGLVSYSRIYLGVHYPGDLLAGILLGCLIGYGGYHLYLLFDRQFLKP